MVQLKILSGKKAGTEMVARHFPFCAGRAANCDLLLDEPGVWDKHFQISLDPAEGFVLTADSNTSVVIDGKTIQRTALRIGDIVEIGYTKVLFGLSSMRQKSLVLREWLTWIALAALCFGQVALIYKLLR